MLGMKRFSLQSICSPLLLAGSPWLILLWCQHRIARPFRLLTAAGRCGLAGQCGLAELCPQHSFSEEVHFRSRIGHTRPLASVCPADLLSHDGFQRVVLLNPGNSVLVYLMSFSPVEAANITVSNYSVQHVARGWTRGVRCFPALRNLPSELLSANASLVPGHM